MRLRLDSVASWLVSCWTALGGVRPRVGWLTASGLPMHLLEPVKNLSNPTQTVKGLP